MQNNPVAFQDALARAREIAQKLSAHAPNAGPSLKRTNSDEEPSSKRPAFGSSEQDKDVPTPVLRAQLIAQQINSQLGVKANPNDSLPLSNQLTFQEDYKIPDKFVGLVIGKGGDQIIRIQQESGCKVQISQIRPEPIPGGPNPPDRVANLSGTRDSIDRAKRIIDDIISRGRLADGAPSGINPYSLGGANSKSMDVMLPSAKCGLIIGKGGETIRRISDEFGVKMFVVQEISDIDGIEHKPLRIIGDADRVERAKQYVLESILKQGPPNSGNRYGGGQSGGSSTNEYGSRTGGTSSNGPCNEANYHVPYDKAGVIIGKGGESIKEIIRKSGAFVEVDKNYRPAAENSGERLFKIRGTPEQIASAQQLMYEKVANSPGGPGELLTPTQFQQKFNLPSMGGGSTDPWALNSDPYSATDLYSQWANAYGQWPQMNSYGDGTGKPGSGASSADAAAAGMDPTAWYNYYQSMSAYMMQSSMTGTASSSGTSTKTTDSTVNSTISDTATTATTSNTGQADYSQQWIEFYRSTGQPELADQIEKQLKESGSSTTTTSTTGSNPASKMMSSADAWAAYAQQWVMPSNGTNASTTSSSS